MILRPSDVLDAQFRYLRWDLVEIARRLGKPAYDDYLWMDGEDGPMTSRLALRLSVLTGVRVSSWLLIEVEYRADRLAMEAMI